MNILFCKLLQEKRRFIVSSLQSLRWALYYVSAAWCIIPTLDTPISWYWKSNILIQWIDQFPSELYAHTMIIQNWLTGMMVALVMMRDWSVDPEQNSDV